MQQRPLALLALFVVNLIYGVNYVVAKGLMPEVIGPSGFILLRAIGALSLFWLVRVFRPERIPSPSKTPSCACAHIRTRSPTRPAWPFITSASPVRI